MELTLKQALEKGIEAHKAGKVQEADSYYTAILKAQPRHPDANHNMGILAVGIGKVEQALPFFKTALEVNQTVEQFWLSYIDALIKLEKFDDASNFLAQAGEKGFKSDAFSQLKTSLLSSQSGSSGTPLSQDPPLDRIQALIALYNQGKFDEVLSGATDALVEFPNSAVLFNLQGAANVGLKKFDAAIGSYNQAIRIKPEWVEAYFNIGNAYKDNDDLEASIRSYKKALKIKPDYAEAHNNMGLVLQHNGDLEASMQSFQAALNIKQDYAKAHNNMGVSLKDKGELKASIESYKKALKIKPDYAEAYNNMGVSLKEQGELKASKRSYEKAIKINPGYADAHFNMGNALKEVGDLEASIESYKRAIRIDPGYAEAYSNLGNVLRESGDLKTAINLLKKALEKSPYHGEAHNNMGATLYGLGNLSSAFSYYIKALTLDPNNKSAWSNLFFPIRVKYFRGDFVDHDFSALKDKVGKSHSIDREVSILKHKVSEGTDKAEEYFNAVTGLMSQNNKLSIGNPNPGTTRHKRPVTLPEEVIALQHFGRSGTGLLHSLMDGHSELSSLPSIYFSEYFDNSTWERISDGGWEEIADRFIAAYPVLFDASAPNPVLTMGHKTITDLGRKEGLCNVGENGDEVLQLDKEVFRSELLSGMTFYDSLDALTFFKLVHFAYEKALGNRGEKNKIFYHIHNPDTYAKLNFVRSVPDARWILMVREPVQSCESWIKSFRTENHEVLANGICSMLLAIDQVIFAKQSSVGVRLEDLKEHPEKTMAALCDWMGIKEEENLYEMTMQGKKWWGDPSSPDFDKKGMSPFCKSSIERKVGGIFSENDQFILETLFYPFRVRFGYVEENPRRFDKDLATIRPMLDQMFDFEIKITKETGVDPEQFMQSGSYQYLRCGLLDRWNKLEKVGTYPDMIKPLEIGKV